MTARVVYYVGDEPMEERCANCNAEVDTDQACPNGCDEVDKEENSILAADPDLTPSQYKQLLELEDENIYLVLELNEKAKERYISYLDENPGPNYHPFEELTDEILMQRALAEDHLAQLELGHRASLVKNSDDAAYWYLKGAQNGNIICAHNYACGVKNDEEAIFWFRKAAFNGMASSQHELGIIYQKRHNYSKSEIWFKLAFRNGILEACTDLGSLYWEQKEIDSAVTYWRIAANLGDTGARKNLKRHNIDLIEPSSDNDGD
jgi:TPR repeat protein